MELRESAFPFSPVSRNTTDRRLARIILGTHHNQAACRRLPTRLGFRNLTCQTMKAFLRISLVGLFALGTISVRAQTESAFKRTEDVIYGRKFGTALTLDVFQPPKPNGCAILFMV